MTHKYTKDEAKESSGAQRTLLWIVVGMGFALVGGSALLIGKIVSKNEECTLKQLKLPAGGEIIGASEEALQLLMANERGEQKLQTYELCHGRLVRELPLTRPILPQSPLASSTP